MTTLITITIYLIGLIIVPKFAISVNDKMKYIHPGWYCDDSGILWMIGLIWPISIFIIFALLINYWWLKTNK